jgi:uncharacterized protein YwqG
MIPDFLEKFRPQIEQNKLETIKILAHPIRDGEKLAIKQSKFLGQPYIPKTSPYPKCSDGSAMIMLAQINFAEVPEIENYPKNGILQLFLDPINWYRIEKTDYKIIFHESDSEDFMSDFSFLTHELYKENPISCEHSLTYKKETEYCGIEDFRFQVDFDGLYYYNFLNTLSDEQQDEMTDCFCINGGHKIGGYAHFTQSDPREDNENLKNDVLLFQIGTGEKIMFGDCGVANVFININDLVNRNFDRAYLNCDSH